MEESIYLVGCRAVGKSSIGRKLAQSLSCSFFDTDSMIIESQGRSVSEIVQEEGWKKFREYEKEVLVLLLNYKRCVVATGGGAILHREVWPHLKKQGTVVWLRADIDVLCQRIQGDKQSASQRPSLTGNDVCRELKEVLAVRSPLYEVTADCIVDTDNMSVDSVVKEIEFFLTKL
jgi:shikimate kinase